MKIKGLPVLVLIAALVLPTLVGAQGETLPGSGWWTGQQIQNVGTAGATIVSTAYDSLSSATYMASAGPIAAGGSVTFLPADFSGMPNGFAGSAVVASDQPIKAIVTLTNRQVGSYGIAGGFAGGQYQGIDGSAAATTVSFPLVKQTFGPKSTTLFVQNAGSAGATVSITYVCGVNTYPFTSSSINPGQMVVLNASAAGVPSGQACSASATSAQPIAGVAVEHYATETVATLAQATRGFTPADGATTIYAPIFKNQFPQHATQSRTAGGQVQNVSGAQITNVHATFYGSGGTCAGTNYTADSGPIANGALYVFLSTNIGGMPVGCLASAKFESSGGNIVGTVNESYLNPAPAPGVQASTAYNMLSASGATTQIAAPLYKEKFGSKTSGLQVQNIGGSSTNVHAIFTAGANVYTTIDYPIAAGSSKTFYLMSDCGASCWVGSAMPVGTLAGVKVVSDGQSILGIASEQTYYVGGATNCYGQATVACYDRLNYEGFNTTP